MKLERIRGVEKDTDSFVVRFRLTTTATRQVGEAVTETKIVRLR
jgi:hypothetical protein